MTQPHHVALVHDGRVLVDETGALPSFVPSEHLGSFTQALSLVGASIAIAPVAELPDGRRLHVVGSRGAPPAGTFVPPSSLADSSLVAALLDSLRTAPGRPAWFLPGWFDLVEGWIDSVLAGSGVRCTRPIEAVKMWSISAVARVPTDGGDLWLKAPCEHFMAEASVLSTVERLFPSWPTLVAVSESEGWLLMEPMSGEQEDTRAPGAGLEVATRWAGAQIAAVAHVDELVTGGCRRRGVSETVAGFRNLLSTSSELALLTSDELAAIRGCTDSLEALVRELWECGIPDTLAHGDLHLGNVAWDGADLRIFDWTDGCVSHPFLDASHLAHFTRAVPGDAGLESTYAEQWRSAYPDADIDRALRLAPLVDLVFQAITFDDIVNTTEPMSRWELGGVVADILRTLPGRVAEAG